MLSRRVYYHIITNQTCHFTKNIIIHQVCHLTGYVISTRHDQTCYRAKFIKYNKILNYNLVYYYYYNLIYYLILSLK